MTVGRPLLLLISATLLATATAEGLVRTLKYSDYDWRAYWAALANALGRRVLRLLPFNLAIPVLGFLWQHRLAQIPQHSAWSLALLFVGAEFCYYWFHRVSHAVRWFWASHAVHHAPNDLSFAVAYQLGWTGNLSGTTLFYGPLVWLGFRPEAVLGVVALNLLYQFWLHARWIPKLGPMEWIFNTPSHHRVHHACNLEYLGHSRLGANYGGVLIVFDRLFGTYVEERADLPCRYGLVERLVSYNPLYIAFHEWMAMGRDLAASPDWRSRFLHVFGPPGWKPTR